MINYESLEALRNLGLNKGLEINYHYETQGAAEIEEPDALIIDNKIGKGFLLKHSNGSESRTNNLTFDITYEECAEDIEKWIKNYNPEDHN